MSVRKKIESLEGKNGLNEFLEKYDSLIDLLKSDNRKLVILSPFDFEWNSANNRYLGLYRDEIASLAENSESLVKGNFIEKLVEQPPEDLVLSVKENIDFGTIIGGQQTGSVCSEMTVSEYFLMLPRGFPPLKRNGSCFQN